MTSIKLKHPIIADGLEGTELNLQRPKVQDLERVGKVDDPIARAAALIADLAGITLDQVCEIDAEDFTAVAEQLGDFRRYPADVRAVMADVALVFGWPPSELRGMEIDELLDWRRMALERVKVVAVTGVAAELGRASDATPEEMTSACSARSNTAER